GDEPRDINQRLNVPTRDRYNAAETCLKENILKTKLLLAVGIVLSVSGFAQTNSQAGLVVEPMAQTPTFRVVVTSRTTPAVNYKHRSGSTKVDFAGTDLMPSADGVAEVNSKQGAIDIE